MGQRLQKCSVSSCFCRLNSCSSLLMNRKVIKISIISSIRRHYVLAKEKHTCFIILLLHLHSQIFLPTKYLCTYYNVNKSYLFPIATQDARIYKKSEACMNFIFSRVIRSDKYMLYNVHSLLDSSQCLVLDCWSEYSGDVL